MKQVGERYSFEIPTREVLVFTILYVNNEQGLYHIIFDDGKLDKFKIGSVLDNLVKKVG